MSRPYTVYHIIDFLPFELHFSRTKPVNCENVVELSRKTISVIQRAVCPDEVENQVWKIECRDYDSDKDSQAVL